MNRAEREEFESWIPGSRAAIMRAIDGADPEARDRRLSLISRFPREGTAILEDDLTRAAVDAGRPWERGHVARCVEDMASPPSEEAMLSLLRLLEGRPATMSFKLTIGLRGLANVASVMPRSWIPRPGTEEASAFLDVCDAAARFVAGREEDILSTLFSGSEGRWTVWRERLIEASPVSLGVTGEAGELDTVLHEVEGVINRFASAVVDPILFRIAAEDPEVGREMDDETAFELASEMILRGVSLEEVVRFAAGQIDDDGTRLRSLHSRLPDAAKPNWTPLFRGRVDLGNGFELQAVTDVDTLMAMSEQLSCESGETGLFSSLAYASETCWSGQSHVVALSSRNEPKGQFMAALGIRYEIGTPVVVEELGKIYNTRTQNVAFPTRWDGVMVSLQSFVRDGVDPKLAYVAFGKLAMLMDDRTVKVSAHPPKSAQVKGIQHEAQGVEAVRGGEIEIDFPKEEFGREHYSGYLIEVPGAAEAAFETWRPWLPKVLSDLDFDGMADRVRLEMTDYLIRFGGETEEPRHAV